MRVHHISNINKALNVLQDCGVRMVNISSDDIVSGNPKLTLGLVWLIALSFDGQKLVNSQAISGIEKSLKLWVGKYTERHGLKVNDFTSAWSDGLAFLYILHATLPDKFDLEAAKKLHPIARLKMAFDLGYNQLQIERLLDPEDVNCHRPDKKSILMYIMCLYNAIHKNNLDRSMVGEHVKDEIQLLNEAEMVIGPNSDSDSGESEHKKAKLKNSSDDCVMDEISLAKSIEDLRRLGEYQNSFIQEVNIVRRVEHTEAHHPSDEFKARPLSTATNFSVEIGDYQSAIEDVLAKLLEAEEIIAGDFLVAPDLADARKLFQSHEDFMLKLSEYQVAVGSALEEGSKLLTESSGLSLEEQNEIKHQLFLLNERWEVLRIKALNIQTKVHQQLAKMQLGKVEELKSFLTSTEDRLSRMSVMGPGPEELRKQMEDHKSLQSDLEAQQLLVESLSNLVIIEDSEYFCDLEDKLVALEERWSHVVKWSAKRWESLQEMSTKYTKLSESHHIINQWLDSRENCLKTMESKEIVEIGAAMERIKCLEFCKNDLQALQSHVTKLDDTVQGLKDQKLSSLNIENKIESINDRIEALTLILDVQQNRIEGMGFHISSDLKSKNVEIPNGWENFEAKLSSAEKNNGTMEVPAQVEIMKKQKSDVENVKVIKLNEKIMEMVYFVDETEATIFDLHQLDTPTQLMLLDKLSERLKVKIDEYNVAKKLLDDVKRELGDDLTVEEQHIQDLGTKYDFISFKIEDLNESLKVDMKKEKFYKNLTGFKLLLADSRDWFKQHANNSQKDDLEKRLHEMESMAEDIKEIGELCKNESGDEWNSWKQDFNQFKESWCDLENAMERWIQEKNGEKSEKFLVEFSQQTEELLSKVNDIELWLDQLEKITPDTKNADFESLNDLFQVKTKFQSLKESCEQQTVIFRELNEKGSDILLEGDDLIHNKRDSNFSLVTKRLTKLNARWNEVTSLVYARTGALEHLSSQYGELKTLMVSESGYLDKLDKLLRKSPENAADAEEISEELDVRIDDC